MPNEPTNTEFDDVPGMGQPARRALASAGITTLRQLSAHTERDILALHGMGPKALGVLRQALAGRGLGFAPAPCPPGAGTGQDARPVDGIDGASLRLDTEPLGATQGTAHLRDRVAR